MIFSLLALFTLLRYWNYRWLIHSFCCYWSANLILNELSTGSSYRNTGSRYRIWHETGVLEFMLLFNIFIEPRSSSYIGILVINSVLILRTNRGKIPQDQHSWFWDRVSIIPYSSVNGMNLDINGVASIKGHCSYSCIRSLYIAQPAWESFTFSYNNTVFIIQEEYWFTIKESHTGCRYTYLVAHSSFILVNTRSQLPVGVARYSLMDSLLFLLV